MPSLLPTAPPAPGTEDARQVRAWVLYDWANSAFTTVVVTALAGPYITGIAQDAVGESGTALSLGPLDVPATAFFAYCTALSVVLQVVTLPLLGALADRAAITRLLLGVCTALGSGTTLLLLAAGTGRHLLAGALFVLANVAYGAAIVLYNAYLGVLVSRERRDLVSSRGFAWGYAGGGLLLALDLALVTSAERVGLTTGEAARLALASAGLWWGGFGLLAVARLRPRVPVQPTGPLEPGGAVAIAVGVGALRGAVRDLRRLPVTLRFLLASLLYNDAIQAVIGLSTVFLTQELYVRQGRPASEATSFLLALVLLIQFVAVGGAVVFERVARATGTRRAILVTLVLWIGVVVYAYGALRTPTQALFLGVAIALVLGGSQALSRSLFSRLVPAGREASFFGLYEVTQRGTSWIGPAVFGTVVALTGSYRQAILSLVLLLAAGIVGLLLTDTDRGEREAVAFDLVPAR
ncbi:MAG: MFS transporter [Actinomycetota bacterium]|nr:MFS transporter [Actinomycetota bacterium]